MNMYDQKTNLCTPSASDQTFNHQKENYFEVEVDDKSVVVQFFRYPYAPHLKNNFLKKIQVSNLIENARWNSSTLTLKAKRGCGNQTDIENWINIGFTQPKAPENQFDPQDKSLNEIYHYLGTTKGILIDDKDRNWRLEHYGPNIFPMTENANLKELFVKQMLSSQSKLLMISSALSLLTGAAIDSIVISLLTSGNALSGAKAEKEILDLVKELNIDRLKVATLISEKGPLTIKSSQVVPGDRLVLTRGDIVPADAVILESKHLTVDESMLTGESEIVLKTSVSEDIKINKRNHLVFRGTVITGGNAEVLVFHTGRHSVQGEINNLIKTLTVPQTPLQNEMEAIGDNISSIAQALCLLNLMLTKFHGTPWSASLRQSISLAVAIIPEGLPTVVRTILSDGVKKLRPKNVLIKNLACMEALGALNILCLDKTGTITKDEMSPVAFIDWQGIHSIDGDLQQVNSYLPFVLSINHDLELLQDGNTEGSSTEKAIFQAVNCYYQSINKLGPPNILEKIISARTEDKQYIKAEAKVLIDGKETEVVCWKGRPSQILSKCQQSWSQEGPIDLDKQARLDILQTNDKLSSEGMRLLGVALRIKQKIVWMGFIALKDVIRSGIIDLVTTAQQSSIHVCMITGDQPATAIQIASQVGIYRPGDRVITGSELGQFLNDLTQTKDLNEAREQFKKISVFSETSPVQKLAIIEAVQKLNLIVAMTGDGVNDGPALRKAHVGIAMGSKGSDVAKDSSDIILKDDDLSYFVEAIKEGKTIRKNLRTALKFMISTNSSELISTLFASLLNLPAPLTSMQLLWLNIVTDILPELAIAQRPGDSEIMNEDLSGNLLGETELEESIYDASILGASSIFNQIINMSNPGSNFLQMVQAQLLFSLKYIPKKDGRSAYMKKFFMGEFLGTIGYIPVLTQGLGSLASSLAISTIPYLSIKNKK